MSIQMKTLNQSLRLAAFFALLSLIAGIGALAYWFHLAPSRPIILAVPERLVQTIRNKQELEEIREGALRIAEAQIGIAKAGNEAIDRLITVAALVAIVSGLELAVIFALLLKIRRSLQAR